MNLILEKRKILEPATISSINDNFSLENLSEDEVRVTQKHIFLLLFDSSLHLAVDLLDEKGESPDEEILKSLPRKILEEKIDMTKKKLT